MGINSNIAMAAGRIACAMERQSLSRMMEALVVRHLRVIDCMGELVEKWCEQGHYRDAESIAR